MVENAIAIVEKQQPIIPLPPLPSSTEIQALSDMAKIVAYSGFVNSSATRDNVGQRAADAFFVMMFGRELGVAAMTALRMIYVIDGKPACSAQLMLSLILRGGAEVQMPDPASVKDVATVLIKRPHSDTFRPYSYTVDMAIRANLLTKAGDGTFGSGKKNWRENREMMMIWRALSVGARMEVPDLIGGLYTVEELAPNTVVNEEGAPVGQIIIERETDTRPMHTVPAQKTEPETKGDQPAEESMRWCDAEALGKIKSWAEDKGIQWSEVSRLAGILAIEDLDAWNGMYSSGKAACEAILKNWEATLANQKPAQPKNAPKPYQWTEEDLERVVQHAWDIWDWEEAAILEALGKVGWTEFSTPDTAIKAINTKALAENRPVIAWGAKYIKSGKTKLVVFDNPVGISGVYGRDRLRALGDDWKTFVESWEEGKHYDFAEAGLPALRITYIKDGGKIAVDEIQPFVPVSEIDFNA